MKIVLKQGNEKKEYTVGYINMLTVRRAMEIQDQIQSDKLNLEKPTPAQLDMIIDFVVETFDKQFTRDDMYMGFPAKGFITRLLSIVNQIMEMLLDSDDLPEE